MLLSALRSPPVCSVPGHEAQWWRSPGAGGPQGRPPCGGPRRLSHGLGLGRRAGRWSRAQTRLQCQPREETHTRWLRGLRALEDQDLVISPVHFLLQKGDVLSRPGERTCGADGREVVQTQAPVSRSAQPRSPRGPRATGNRTWSAGSSGCRIWAQTS